MKSMIKGHHNGGKNYVLIDAPGIGCSCTKKLEAHIQAGGSVLHAVDESGVLARPEDMWPRRGLEGKKVRIDGTVIG